MAVNVAVLSERQNTALGYKLILKMEKNAEKVYFIVMLLSVILAFYFELIADLQKSCQNFKVSK